MSGCPDCGHTAAVPFGDADAVQQRCTACGHVRPATLQAAMRLHEREHDSDVDDEQRDDEQRDDEQRDDEQRDDDSDSSDVETSAEPATQRAPSHGDDGVDAAAAASDHGVDHGGDHRGAEAKAIRLLADRRVSITKVTPGAVDAQVRGDSATYSVS